MRSLRNTSGLLVLAAALAPVGCQHSGAANTTGTPAQPNQADTAQAQGANAPRQVADSQTQPSNVPPQPATSSTQSAPGGVPGISVAPAQAQSAPPSPPNPPIAAGPVQPAQGIQTPQHDDSSSAQNQPPQVTIPEGTPIEIRLTQSLGSVRSASGQSFAATLDAPIVVGNAVVVPSGANVTGRVLFAKHSGRLKGPAELAVTLTSLEVGGQDYTIVTSHKSWRGRSHKRRNLAWIGGGGGAGSLIGAVAGGGVGAAIGAGVGAGGGTVTAFVTGKRDIVLPSETRLRFVLRRPIAVS